MAGGKPVHGAPRRGAGRSTGSESIAFGGESQELVPAGKFTDVRARWSPDGKRIAYTCRLLDVSSPPLNFGTETYLKLVDSDGSNLVTLLTEKVHPRGPSLELTAWR